MKKLSVVLLAVIAVTASAVPAFAHCGGHGGAAWSANYPTYATCAISTCTYTGLHNHGGRTYAAHYYGDGHNYHNYSSYGYRHH